jgi:hypothetical protein
MDEERPKMDPLWEQQSEPPQADTPPPAQVIVQAAQPDAAGSATDQTPPPNPISPPQPQFIQGQMQPMNMGMGMGMGAVPQQVVYVPLKFQPTTNYRTISYIVLAIGFLSNILGNILAEFTGAYILSDLSTVLCCGSFTAVLFLDAAYYKGKSDWQAANGMSNTGSMVSLVLDTILGFLCALFFVLFVLGEFI